MQTTIFEVTFSDGRKFRVFCQGKNQIKRFGEVTYEMKNEIESITVLTNGIHTISEFEKISKVSQSILNNIIKHSKL